MGILLLCLLGVTVLCSFIITAYGYSCNACFLTLTDYNKMDKETVSDRKLEDGV